MKAKRFEIYKTEIIGGYSINVWDDDDQMYPVFFNQKFYGYDLKEIKNIIREKLEQKYPDYKVVIAR